MNELIFTESQSMREDYISKDYVLDKVKGLVFLPDNINVTTEMVANYYEVPEGTIKSLIFDHKDEVESDGLKVLSGEELSSFKKLCQISSRAKALVIIPRRAILRIGMLLRDSEVAKKVRTYLLNIEENTDTYSRIVALVSDSSNKVNIIDNRLLRMENIVDTLESVSEEQRHIINLVLNKLDEILNQPLFRLNENMSNAYDNLVLIEFANYLNISGNPQKKFKIFNDAFDNWIGEHNDKINNRKQYYIYKYGIEAVRQFVFGIKQGIIQKNKYNNWSSLSGIYSNKVEWNKLLNEFNRTCAYCGANEFETSLMADHLIPQSIKGSTDIYYNLVPCCSSCNESKNNSKTSEWFKRQEFYTEEKQLKISEHFNTYKIKH